MLRTALRPRWLAALGVVLVLATGMSLLGQWQLDRARDEGDPAATTPSAAPRPVADVLRPRQTFPAAARGQRVTVAGRWDGARRLLVTGRTVGGRDGFWVLLPVVLPDGSAVPVVRGWVPSADDPAAAAPTGAVTLTGRLEPAEPAVPRAPGDDGGLTAGRVERVAATDLVTRWPYPLTTGYVVQEGQRPAASPAPVPVPADPPARGLAWRNLSYALQWWVFAAFGLLFWWRLVRDDHRGRLRPTAPAAGAVPTPEEDVDAHGDADARAAGRT